MEHKILIQGRGMYSLLKHGAGTGNGMVNPFLKVKLV